MTIKEILNKGSFILKENNIENPKLKARLLLQFVLNKKREYLIIYDNKNLSRQQEEKYFIEIDKLLEGIPLQHITHHQEFMKMSFYVNEDVLIPRPDTEVLVEEVIKIGKKFKAPVILDLCTGSGAIAVSLAKYIPHAKVYASDISSEALKIARKNAINNGVSKGIKFIKSDLFENIKDIKFDIIVSNPPYIKKEDIKNLNDEVRREPIIALDGGNDGLKFYKKITKNAYKYLKNNGYLCYEIGYDQKIDVIEILENEKKYRNIYSLKDLYDNDRIVISQI